MLASDRILALDIGASKLVLAEFSMKNSTEPVLMKYAVGELQNDPEVDTDAGAFLVATLSGLMRDNGIKPAPLLMTLPGQSVFPRYVKLPPVGPEKVAEMVAYEAEQNVPFPINEVVWDYQILGEGDGTEISALLVAVKSESVKTMVDRVEAAGLEPEIIDAAPMALYNAVRFNYPDADGCTMVLDIGARSTNLIFVEGTRVFTRSIPVAGNSITQDIAKGLNLGFAEAEAIKRKIGFVALGGVYAMTDDERADRVSKVVRNVATRLHAEVNRSINFYRSQQGGTPPTRVLLTGGTALIPHMDTFFREKLQVDVEFFNPFINVPVDPSLEGDEAQSGQLMQLGSVVGLALRRAMHCPVEVNLLPPDLVARKTFRRRLPYLGLSAVGIVLAMLCWYAYAQQLRGGYEQQHETVRHRLADIQAVQRQIDQLVEEQRGYQEKTDLLRSMAVNRHAMARTLETVRANLLPGMWLTGLRTARSDTAIAGYDRIMIEGLGYEDELARASRDGSAARSIDQFLSRLVDDESGLFKREGSRVQRTLLQQPGRILREFAIELRLHQPLGNPVALVDIQPPAE